MSQPDYSSNSQTTNFARASRVILGPCRNVLCAILDKKINPSVLLNTVKRLIKEGKKLPFTVDRIEGKNYVDFDITLLYSLFRNIDKLVTPHAQGWGKDPGTKDRSMSANIERIRIIRNKYAHSSEYSIADKEFKHLWKEIFQIVQELEKDLGTTVYQDGVKEIETCTMDPEESKMCIEKFVQLNKRVDAVSEELKQMKKSVVPSNVQEIYKKVVSEWKKKDGVYFETHSFPAMFDKVKSQPYVTFVGTPGSGKSATAHHIALKLQNEEGYDILPIKEVNKIEDYCDPECPQVFVIDDVVGVFGFNNGQFEMLERYKDRIISAELSKTKLIMTCREVVFRNETLSKCFLAKKANVIQLQSEVNRLSDEDKLSLLANYGLNEGLIPSKRMSETSAMFPFLCKMFSEQTRFSVNEYDFFITPIKYIKDALDEMQTRNKIHYVSLVLLMLHQNKLSETDLVKELIENKPIDIKEVFRKCKVRSHTDSFEIVDAMKEMDGTYTQTCDDQFCFIHDSMFEIVACQFGRQFPELILKYMSSEYIANYIKVDTNDGEINENESEEMLENIEHLSITLQESELPMLAERFFIDLKDGEFNGIFKYLKHPSVMQAFQQLIKKKQYDELFTAFLSYKEGHFLHEHSMLLFAQTRSLGNLADVVYLLPDGSIITDLHSKFVRAIRWFVLCGQHGILQHIIDQMMIQKGNINDLFLTLCNICTEVNITGTEIERTEDDDTTVKTITINFVRPKIQKKSILCFKNADTSKEIANNDLTRTGYRDSELDRKSDIDINSEEMIVEQWRLLCLGCHSGDVNTVKILLKYVNKAALSMHIKHFLRSYIKNPLTVACRNGNFDIAKELIRSGANIITHIDDNYKNSYLSDCCSMGKGHWNIAKELIKAGADVNNRALSTPLINACEMNNLSAVRLLIKVGADLNLKSGYKSPLQVSYDANNLKIADELIKAGANANSANGVQSSTRTSCNKKSEKFKKRNNADIDINPNQKKKSTKYKTPLILACEKKYYHKVRLLIRAGADIHKGDGHRTPLVVACQNRDLKIFNMLIKAGADVNPMNVKMSPHMVACNDGDLKCVQDWIKKGALLNLKTENGAPLLTACKQDNNSVFEELIKEGADVNLEARGENPLKVLLQAGADFNQKAGYKTPLLLASQNGYTDVVDEFVKTEADFNLRAQNETQLTDVCKETNMNVKEWLDKMETDFNLGMRYKSQLLTACLRKQLTIADLIKTDGDSITCKDNNIASRTSKCLTKHSRKKKLIKPGATSNPTNILSFLMKTACQTGHSNLVKELIEVGVDINLIDGNETPLIIACQKGHVTVIKELIKAGVDVDMRAGCKYPRRVACKEMKMDADKFIQALADVNMGAKCTYPLTVACEEMQIDAVKELIQAGADVNLEGSNETPLIVVCEVYSPRGFYLPPKFGHPCNVFKRFDKKLQIRILEALIKAGSDVNMKACYTTPLISVCNLGNIDAVKLFLESGADVNLASARGITPLTAACARCHLDVVEELVKAGANVNQKDSHQTPLTTAIYNSSIAVMDIVIKAGADVNLKDKDHTPLTLACQKSNLRIIAALINAGADVNLKAWKKRPLTVACTKEHFDVVKYLIQKGACVNLDDGIKTPLEIAYERKCMRIVEYLVNAGASINLIKDVFAPITVACQMGRINDVRKMIKAGTELNPTNVDKTPLTAACQKGHLSLVKELINAGASVDLMDRFSTPLTTACLWGHLSVVKELINAGASVDKIDKYNTPLTTACIWGHLDIVKELIRAGSNVNLRDVSNTPLTNACYWRELEIVKELIKSGADVNLQDEENTPLTIACLKNRIDIVKELIKAKANVNVEAGGYTPLTAACKKGDRCIVEMLIKAGADVNRGIEIETTDTDEDTDE